LLGDLIPVVSWPRTSLASCVEGISHGIALEDRACDRSFGDGGLLIVSCRGDLSRYMLIELLFEGDDLLDLLRVLEHGSPEGIVSLELRRDVVDSLLDFKVRSYVICSRSNSLLGSVLGGFHKRTVDVDHLPSLMLMLKEHWAFLLRVESLGSFLKARPILLDIVFSKRRSFNLLDF
jgi:hypothetical protein